MADVGMKPEQPLWLKALKGFGIFIAMCAVSWPFFLVPATLLNAIFSNAWNAGVLAFFPAVPFAVWITGYAASQGFNFEPKEPKKELPPYEGFPTYSVVLTFCYLLSCFCIQYCIYLFLKAHYPDSLSWSYGFFAVCECQIAEKFLTKKGRKKMFGREAEFRDRSHARSYNLATLKGPVKRDQSR